jgi:hypothetical protein
VSAWGLLRLRRLPASYLRSAPSLAQASNININVAQVLGSAQLYLVVLGPLLLGACLVPLVWRRRCLIRHGRRRLWSLLVGGRWRRRHLVPLLGTSHHGASHHLWLLGHAGLRWSAAPLAIHLTVAHGFHLLRGHLLAVEVCAGMRARWSHHRIVRHLRVELRWHAWGREVWVGEVHVGRRRSALLHNAFRHRRARQTLLTQLRGPALHVCWVRRRPGPGARRRHGRWELTLALLVRTRDVILLLPCHE